MCSSSGNYRSQMPFWVALEPIVWRSRLGGQPNTPYGRAGLTPAKRLPSKGGGLYIGSPNEKGCHQGASSLCKFPTITVPGRPSPHRETGDQCCLSLLSFPNLQTSRDRQLPPTAVAGPKECSGGGHVPTPNPMTMLDSPKNIYFQARTSWDWPGGRIFGWECSPNHLW